MIHVCPLSCLVETVSTVKPSHLVTLINAGTPVETPPTLLAANHLRLGFNDICEPMEGLTCPSEEHVSALIGFVCAWDRSRPIVIHCWAGISRSTAAAYITACTILPDRDEEEIASALRRVSPSATPNARLVALADQALGRDGRMVRAIDAIGRGADAIEGRAFMLAP